MRIPSTNFLRRPLHGFSARNHQPLVQALRALRHWFRQATDRAIGAQLSDLRINPFLFITETRC